MSSPWNLCAAAEASSGVQAVAMLAVLGVLGASITFLVRRSRARAGQKRQHDEALIAALPEEYRPRFEDKWLEEVYGPKMKPLRSLLPTSPGSALRPDELG